MKTFKTLMNSLIKEREDEPAHKTAVFIVGPPGSGKNYVGNKVFDGNIPVHVDADEGFEHRMKKLGLDPSMPPEEEYERETARHYAKETAKNKMNLSIRNGNGMVINTTGAALGKTARMKEHLENNGYTTHMLYVDVDNNTSKERNEERGRRNGRAIPERARQSCVNCLYRNKPIYKEMFGDNFKEFDNSINMETASPEEQDEYSSKIMDLWKHYRKLSTPNTRTPNGISESKIPKFDVNEWAKHTYKNEYYDLD